LVEENGKAAVKFDGTDDFLSNTLPSTISQPTYWFVTHNFHSTPSAYNGVIGNLSTDPEHRLIVDASLLYSLQAGGAIKYNSYQTSQSLVSYKIDSSDERFYFNGSEQTASGTGIGSDGLESIILGAINETSGNTPVQFQEIILFDSDQGTNRTGIENNIGRYYNIDGFTDGRVATWYDQANANHATQSTPDQQPLIVSDGALVLENSKPAIQFDGVNDLFETVSDWSTGDSTTFHVVTVNDTTGYQTLLGSYYNTINTQEEQVIYDGLGWRESTNSVSLGQNLLEYTYFNSATEIKFFNNGSSNGSVTMLGTQQIDNIIGSFNDNGNYLFTGKYQELIHYNSDQSANRQDIGKNIADYYEITLSGNSGVESWVKNVSFADMYQIWFDYEYLHRLFANFEVPNQVNKILAYVTELTIEQRETIVYPYLKEDYHPIYTPYQQRVQADSGDTDAGKTNTLNKIDNI